MRSMDELKMRVRGLAMCLARSRHTMLTAACSATATLLLCGCTGTPGINGEVGTQPSLSIPADVLDLGLPVTTPDGRDPNEMSITELISGPGAQELGASRLLRESGVLDLLESYIINMPPSAEFISVTDLIRGSVAADDYYEDIGASRGPLHLFEKSVLLSASWVIRSVPQADRSQVLHDAFFGVLEQCGRDSPWPEVEMYAMREGFEFGYDVTPARVESFGLSHYEYLELRHACARYAATYPTLDATVRDELLAPQRAFFAREILDRLDNEMPVVEIPPEYQDAIDDLRANGW